MTLFLIALLLIAILATQVVFFIWVSRQIKKQSKPLSPQTYRSLCLGIAGVLLAVSFAASIYTIVLLTTGVKTTGVVVEIREHEDKEDHSKSFAPIFAFVDESGARNIIESDLFGSSERYKVGNSVPVIYSASNPRNARINAFAENWFVPIMTSIFAAGVLVSIPIRNRWLEYRMRRKQPPTEAQLARL